MSQQELNEKFLGEWLLLFNDKIIDHSNNIEDILKLAEKFPNDEIKISKVIDGTFRAF